MKLAQWARENQINEDTAYRWFPAGVLPVPARQLPTGTILVDVSVAAASGVGGRVALYARVSSADQRGDIERRLVVVDAAEVEDDLARDVTEVLTTLCARLYGRRLARRRAEAAHSAAGQGVR